MPTYRPTFQLVSVRETKDLVEVALPMSSQGFFFYTLCAV